jgi:uncharacterized membrane protein YgcG
MNTKYFLYALALTLITTVINWSSALSHLSGAKSGSSYRSSGSSIGGGSFGGGGHK